MKDIYQNQNGSTGWQQAQGLAAAPIPTRFSSCGSRLQAQVSRFAELTDRANKIANRLGGAVPEAVGDPKTKSDSSCTAAIIEAAQNDLESIESRLNSIIERLETL
jgi:hypothetical protein